MVRGWQSAGRFAALAMCAALVSSGCKGSNKLSGNETSGSGQTAGLDNPDPPCTDPDICCPAESVVVLGSPDDERRVCLTLWTCDDPSRPYKCWSPLPMPYGGATWECTWSESTYTCSATTSSGDEVPGGAGWDCVEQPNGEFVDWTCTYAYPPNPANNPGGTSFYECDPNGESDRLECEPKGDTSGSTPGTTQTTTPKVPDEPSTTSTNPVGPDFGPWVKTEEGGKTIWKRTGAAPLEDGICTRETINGQTLLVCFGDNPVPGGQAGYDCWDAAEFDKDVCTMPLTDDHRPDGMADGVCMDSIEMGQIIQICEETVSPPNAMPAPGSKCEPRTRRWCDGTTFCGWGIIECNDDGTWPTTRKRDRDGVWHTVEDCQEHPDGLRPDTACARYYWFFNPECCEREDCVIPPGTNGRAYVPSEGNLCDPCNPSNPECDQSKGSLCVYRKKTIRSELIGGRTYPTGESYCGQQCGANLPCPKGFSCVQACEIDFDGWGMRCGMQCVPENDGSCYLRPAP